MFGTRFRQNLGEAYTYLINNYQPEDRIYVFGFSRGAYTARALTGMQEIFGIFRQCSDNLVPYAVSAYAKQQRRESRTKKLARRRGKRSSRVCGCTPRRTG